MRSAVLIVLFALGSVGVVRAQDETPKQDKPKRPTSIDLRQYVAARQGVRMDRVRRNASGVTYSPKTKTLFVVCNGPTVIAELTTDGATKRLIDLEGFADTEGIAHVDGDTFAVAEEGRRRICLVTIGPQTKSVDYAGARKIQVDRATGGNKGLEGVAYDPAGKQFFGVKEKGPLRVYRVVMATDERKKPKVGLAWNQWRFRLGDLAGIHFHAPTGTLLIVSDESKCVVECTVKGKPLGKLKLSRRSAGLTRDVPQPEGVTADPAGTLYVVSEPNLLYIFTKRPTAQEKKPGK